MLSKTPENNWAAERERKYRDFFRLEENAELIPANCAEFESAAENANLVRFNIEWHFVPSADIVPFDENYLKRFYPTAFCAGNTDKRQADLLERIRSGHRRQQGYVVGVETTQKPVYLPRNRQFYGTNYGHDAATDPLAAAFGAAGITTGTRFDQNYPMLRRLLDSLNENWRKQKLLPAGYRVTVCPPAIFNLIGTIFHPEWSATESLELEQNRVWCTEGVFSYRVKSFK